MRIGKNAKAEAESNNRITCMNGQIDIFDFIEIPKTLFEQIFERIDNPVILCANCLCQYCANNMDELWKKVKPEEVQKPCYNCEECYTWSGECRHRQQVKEDCNDFILSNYGAERNRKKIMI